MRTEPLENTLSAIGKWVEEVVQAAMRESKEKQDGGPMLFTEEQAAEKLAVKKHVLRDARQRGEIDFVRIGKGIRYEPAMLKKFVADNKNREMGRR